MPEPRKRLRIDVAYDGRPFDGWQSQPSGNTIQDRLLAAIREICPSVNSVHGSGRTDAGVCADRQVAHFDVPDFWGMDPDSWRKALNSRLPPLIRILDCRDAAPDFHARYSATGKVYRYRIFTGDVLPPLEHGLAWHRRDLEEDSLLDAMGLFLGTHHFRAFSANRNDGRDAGRDTERTIREISGSGTSGDLFSVTIAGDGFLYKMVRFLIGSGAWIVRGKLSRDQAEAWLGDPDTTEKAPYCAPPSGLSLEEVRYDSRI